MPRSESGAAWISEAMISFRAVGSSASSAIAASASTLPEIAIGRVIEIRLVLAKRIFEALAMPAVSRSPSAYTNMLCLCILNTPIRRR